MPAESSLLLGISLFVLPVGAMLYYKSTKKTVKGKDCKIVNHSDLSRINVGATAHAVAYMRSHESGKPGAFYYDPLALALGGEVGQKFSEERMAGSGKDIAIWSNGIAVRTKKIDDECKQAIAKGIKQICVIGAGLDTRAWRLGVDSPEAMQSSVPGISQVSWFEVDFQELFDYKLSITAQHNARLVVGKYITVSADLSQPNWENKLAAAGFDAHMPSMWLLEGFTGYLTEAELVKVFDIMSSLSAVGSALVATFIGTAMDTGITMHRFKTDDPVSFVNRWFWKGTSISFSDVAKLLGRDIDTRAGHFENYYLVTATYEPSS